MAQKILIVEDDEFLGDIISRKLKSSGYEIVLAKDGRMGLEMMRTENPDLVLLDIVMPNVNGYEVLEIMQQEQGLKSIPVIIISNSGQPVEISRVMSLGVKDYLIKADFSPDEVLAKVREYLPSQGAPAATGALRGGADTHATQAEGKTAASAPGGGQKLLVVEDDAFLKDLIARRLSQEFDSVIYASDGKQAIEMAQAELPDIILLDLILPEIGGFEVLKQVKENPKTKHARVIILSNLGQQEDIDKGAQLGAEAFMVKANFTIDEIIDKIKSISE